MRKMQPVHLKRTSHLRGNKMRASIKVSQRLEEEPGGCDQYGSGVKLKAFAWREDEGQRDHLE